MKHKLKTNQEYLDAIRSGVKRFEIRRDDRGFNVGDILWLKGWDPEKEEYTGDELKVDVLYILRDAPHFGLAEGFCNMSIQVRVSEVKPKKDPYEGDLEILAKYPGLQIDGVKWSHLDYLPHRHITFQWSSDIGYGEFCVGLDKDGQAFCDTEYMGGSFVRALMTLFYLEANPQWDPRKLQPQTNDGSNQ